MVFHNHDCGQVDISITIMKITSRLFSQSQKLPSPNIVMAVSVCVCVHVCVCVCVRIFTYAKFINSLYVSQNGIIELSWNASC